MTDIPSPPLMPPASGSGGIPGRLMGVDYGSRRIGVAVSDALGITTRPLTAIDRKKESDPVSLLADLVATEEISGVIVGLPRHDDGTPGAVAKPATALARRLVAVLVERHGPSAPPVRMHDETSTSAEARERLRSMGKLPLAPDGRPLDRGAIDAASAAVLLERYLAEGPMTEPLTAETPGEAPDGDSDGGEDNTNTSDLPAAPSPQESST